MESPATQDENDAERDRQLAAELDLLRKERDQILAAAHQDHSPLFNDILHQTNNRLKRAARHRDLQLANLRAAFQVDVQQACNEFDRDKRRLCSQILAVTIDRRRRLESLRHAAVGKKKKRARSNPERDRISKLRLQPDHPLLTSLERQGMFRIAATPDEINSDLALILHGIDSARYTAPSRPTPDRTGETTTKTVDKIHSSRGILHYHDITYEKGDRVSIFNHAKHSPSKLILKYTGTLLSVNAKEILVRTESGSDHKVYVTHLRNGKYVLKPTPADEPMTI